ACPTPHRIGAIAVARARRRAPGVSGQTTIACASVDAPPESLHLLPGASLESEQSSLLRANQFVHRAHGVQCPRLLAAYAPDLPKRTYAQSVSCKSWANYSGGRVQSNKDTEKYPSALLLTANSDQA